MYVLAKERGVVSLNYLDGFDQQSLSFRYPPLEHCLFRKAGYCGLAHALLSESELSLLWSPILSRLAGQERCNAGPKAGVVPGMWPECGVEHEHRLF